MANLKTNLLLVLLVCASPLDFSILSASTVTQLNQSNTDPDSMKIASLVEQQVAENNFEGTVLVAQAGKVIYHQSFGYAYRKENEATNEIQNDFHFGIASVTKTFTALRILQLIENQQLSIEQTVLELLPEFDVPRAKDLTIHTLLLHLSGLPTVRRNDYIHPLQPDEFVRRLVSRKGLTDLGSFKYSDTEYLLLGLIIEKITGQDWRENIQKNILDPLDMSETGFLAYGEYPKRFAYTYQVSKSGKFTQDPFFYIENFYAAGCMYSTAEDLLKLDQALYDNCLIGSEMYQKLATSYPEYGYAGYSVWNYTYPFVDSMPTVMERRGGILGANVVLVRMPNSEHTIIILSNNSAFNPDSFGDPNNMREAIMRVVAD
ncbi:MAG: serine hydrolase domain-containing protein [Bacteroidota bacterium]